MPSKPNYKPEGYNNITPMLSIESAAKAIDFYKNVFGAKEVMRFEDGKGKIGHCELLIGDSKIMLSDIFDDTTVKHSPFSFGIHLYVENADAVCEKALAAGAKLLRPLDTKFYGDRSCAIQDPFGHTWHISTHVEDVSLEETAKRAKEEGNRLKELK